LAKPIGGAPHLLSDLAITLSNFSDLIGEDLVQVMPDET